MNKMEEKQLLQGDSFYMEFLDEDTHSMIDEEIFNELNKKIKLAKHGVDDFRRKKLKEQLEKQGVDSSTVDVDKMLGISEMLLDFKYYKLNSGLIIKVNTDEMLLYILDDKNKVWRENPKLFTEFERECFPKEEIEMEDNFKIGEPCENGRVF